MISRSLHFGNRDYWEMFFSSGWIIVANLCDGKGEYRSGEKLHIINDDSIHNFFPFAKNYGIVEEVLYDPDILVPEGKQVIYCQFLGAQYLFIAGFFGLLGICCLLSLLGVI